MAADQIDVDRVLQPSVYASVAREAMLQQAGVVAVGGGKRAGGTKGVRVRVDNRGSIRLQAWLILDYGHGAFTLGEQVQRAVIAALAQVSQRPVSAVDLTFSHIRLTRAQLRRNPKG